MLIKKLFHIVVLMLCCVVGKAQLIFSISPVAGSSKAAVFASNPIVVDGKGQCVVGTSGLAAMMIANNGTGQFSDGCKEVPPVASVETFSLSLNVYPNPTSGLATIKCSGEFDESLSCRIRVFGIDGKMMFTKTVPIKEVRAGYQLDATSYAVGTYAVVIDFMNHSYSLKLMKM